MAGCATQPTAPSSTPEDNTPVETLQPTQENPTTPETIVTESQNNEPQTPESNEPSGISLSELTGHNKRADCWVGYKGKVYDITSFIPKHPGGAEKIIPYCGAASEFESVFTKQHDTKQVNKLMSEGTYMGDLQ